MKIRNIINGLIMSAITTFALTSCDDGHVDDPTNIDTTDCYTVKITGIFQGLHTWNGNYTVDAACFEADNEFSVIQKVLPSESTDSTVATVVINKVPTTAKTVEIAVMNTIRKRIATIYSYEIPSGWDYNDTIDLNVGKINVGMFAAINKFVFQNSAVNCAKCHASAEATAHLDLTEANAYKSLVNVTAYKDSTSLRVKPNDADNSYLYRVLTTGTDEVHYQHSGLLSDYQAFVDIIKSWINSGAKQ